ncbi:D-amino acid dehydrogenase small subunit [Pirellulimonas nuda]|uniref:D-amino acid dehydrogenase small subunit n=1 Tax=Pirellulimonas nuda TaxID=2528009 RepID=A0A518DBB0_9BACT|nr:FAD-dependent oxidoreductase [Pirellulimonas nuda]QDU88775.1 D-amino acid dehydrogenase small subunit [Pirellulimonas nuda]
MSERSAIVIGGGLIGCCSAYYLAKLGWRVRLLERQRIGAGASHGNCGFVCPSHVMPLAAPGAVTATLRTMLGRDSPIALRLPPSRSLVAWLTRFAGQCNEGAMARSAAGRHALLAASAPLYRQMLEEERIDCQWQDDGLLVVYSSPQKFEAFGPMAALLAEKYGVESAPYPGDNVKVLEPALRAGLAGGWHFRGDSHVRPDRLLAGLKGALARLEVDVSEGVAVQQMVVAGGRLQRLETSQGPLTADACVLATGAEAPAFARPLGCRMPIQPGKGYSLTMPTPAGAPRLPMIFEEHHVAVTPFRDGLRIGSTMEFAGYDRGINQKRLALLLKSAREHLAAPPPDQFDEVWSGWRPMVYDGLPCIDRAPRAANVVVAAGNGMIGLASAPATGKLAAEIVAGLAPHVPAAPYRLARFA